MINLDEKNIIITGGAGRIGYAAAQEILNLNCKKLILVDNNQNALNDCKNKLHLKEKQSLKTILGDTTNSKSIKEILKESLKDASTIHGCVHSAYPRNNGWGATIENLEDKILFENINMQLGGSILISKAICELFNNQGFGSLVHISSIQGLGSPKFWHYQNSSFSSPIEYTAIKSGLISITKWLSKYYSGKKIRVNCISPGGILSGQDKSFLKAYRDSCNNIGMLNPQHLAPCIAFLLSDSAEAINGQNLIIDDGWSL
mgnify:CR=1 FL=1